jgi:hypothetical protein
MLYFQNNVDEIIPKHNKKTKVEGNSLKKSSNNKKSKF